MMVEVKKKDQAIVKLMEQDRAQASLAHVL